MIRMLFASFVKLLGGVPAGERTGLELIGDNALSVEAIPDKHRFLNWLIASVPDGSTWSIEGIHDAGIVEFLSRYPVEDNIPVNRGTVWPRPRSLKVALTAESKKEILKQLPTWNLDAHFIHQHIYLGSTVFLTAYDNLDDSCTVISKELGVESLDSMERDGIATLFKEPRP